MNAAARNRFLIGRGANLLLAHCAVLEECEGRAPVGDRLRQLIGPELTRLLLVALVGDHRMESRDLAA
jgi:hypothetical protein